MAIIYETDFPNAGSVADWTELKGEAYTVQNIDWQTTSGETFAVCRSGEGDRYSWDANHYYPGVGYVNVMAAILCNGVSLPATLDLRGGHIEFEIRCNELYLPNRKPRLVHWIQGEDDTAFNLTFNHYYRAACLDDYLGFGGNGMFERPKVDYVRDSGWRTVSIPYSSDDALWAPMGSRPERTGRGDPNSANTWYGAVKADDALRQVNLDLGILAIWPNEADPTIPPAEYMDGELWIRAVRIYDTP